SGGADKAIKVLDAFTGQETHSLAGHQGDVHTLAFDRDDRLASCATDATICLWDLKQGKLTHKLTGHKARNEVHTIIFGGPYLFSADSDRTARAWDHDTGKEVQILAEVRHRFYAVACTKDGSRWAASDSAGNIYVGTFLPKPPQGK